MAKYEQIVVRTLIDPKVKLSDDAIIQLELDKCRAKNELTNLVNAIQDTKRNLTGMILLRDKLREEYLSSERLLSEHRVVKISTKRKRKNQAKEAKKILKNMNQKDLDSLLALLTKGK